MVWHGRRAPSSPPHPHPHPPPRGPRPVHPTLRQGGSRAGPSGRARPHCAQCSAHPFALGPKRAQRAFRLPLPPLDTPPSPRTHPPPPCRSTVSAILCTRSEGELHEVFDSLSEIGGIQFYSFNSVGQILRHVLLKASARGVPPRPPSTHGMLPLRGRRPRCLWSLRRGMSAPQPRPTQQTLLRAAPLISCLRTHPAAPPPLRWYAGTPLRCRAPCRTTRCCRSGCVASWGT